MNKETIQLMIYLPGNSIPLNILRKDKSKFDSQLFDVCNSEKALWFTTPETKIKSHSIMGWGFREIQENVSDKMLEILKSQIDDESDDWKQ